MFRKSNSIYIDAMSFAQTRKSGIGHIAEEMSGSLSSLFKDKYPNRKIYLVVPLFKAKYLKKYVNSNVGIRTIPLPAKVLNILTRINLVPPLDIFLGSGNYIFPNYRNWPLLRSRSFTYIHDISFIHFPEYTEPKNLVFIRSNIQSWIKRSTKIITSSDYTKHEIERYLHTDPKNVSVVHHGVDASVFCKQKNNDYKKIINNYGVNEDNFVTHVGNIEPRKNITGLIAAYCSLSRVLSARHPLLLIGGDGWLNDSEKVAIQQAITDGYKIIRPKKYVEDRDLVSFYSASSVLVMPSRYEGFGIPPLQAMSIGVPTVVSNNSSLAELFSDASILVDPASVESIASGIKCALEMSAEELSVVQRKGKAIADSLSWRHAAESLIKVVDSV